jgi:quercetin dioxygenase-like cupin family protein
MRNTLGIFCISLVVVGIQSCCPESLSSKKGIANPVSRVKFEQSDAVKCLMEAVEVGGATGPSTLILKASPNCDVPWHYHQAVEQLIVINGPVLAEMDGMEAEILEAGGFAMMPSRRVHQFTCHSPRECSIIVSFDRTYDVHWCQDSKKCKP